MIPRARLQEVTEADIQGLIDHGVPEGRTLDYKRDWPRDQDARSCSHSHQRSKGASKHREGEIVAGELVVTSGDATKMFDAIEEAFDDVSSSIQHAAVPTFGLSIRARRDNGLRARRADGVHEGVRVVTFVSNHGTRAQMLDQFVRTRNVRDLSFSDNHSQRPPGFIDGQMQLGRQSSARAAERLRAAFFRAPAECWCARTMVESISTRLISVSSDTACATRSHTPLRRHREKRMYTVCHRPNSFGKSRHGQPVRSIQRTASTNQRLSVAVRPGSPSLPGKTDSIRAHTSSLNNVRIILARSRKRQDVNTFHRM